MNVLRIVGNIILVLLISAIFSSCVGQSKVETNNTEFEQNSIGEVVTELAPNTHLMYQESNHNYWFVNDKEIYKYDGKTLLLFTLKDGLISNRILGIQEDKFGNIYFDTPEGVSQFNGQQFKTLKVIDGHSKKELWKLEQNEFSIA